MKSLKTKIRKILPLAIAAPMIVFAIEARIGPRSAFEDADIRRLDFQTVTNLHSAYVRDYVDSQIVYLNSQLDSCTVAREDCQFATAGYGNEFGSYKPYIYFKCDIDKREKILFSQFRYYPDSEKVSLSIFRESVFQAHGFSFAERAGYSLLVFVVLCLLSHRKLNEWLRKGRGKRIVEWLGSGHGTNDALEREIEETEAFDRMLAEGKAKREKNRKQNGKAKYIP
ncbi:hypothetical protein SAMN05720761_1436 [Fibrobacter sp. UWCM]|nr:hypothetical protein SAMN05720761_1436 [Fibrobacter sp. UWCM]